MRILERKPQPKGLAKFLFRLPIHLYRIGLGRLLGGRFLLLHHRGRVSGKPRQVVIEVVHHDSTAGSYTVASGFGAKADWYRNVLADPEVRIQVGGKKGAATAVPLDTEAGAEVMAEYASRHKRAAKALCRYMGFEVDGGAADFREAGRHIPFLRLLTH
ncbi:deazaflavin-dependent oxidoreductase, nitroreductase family [Amycolatopsis marina]|uniref:Deazaflavin-dependent oxidoreductase, nitroreductase family n=1 Tax=Amycolatopsis marina TaxID=490629 RepID=A0A1I0X024_9PSEU|nr:nitroreductase family deazaflavin-dependent oxidoreductase [Amycolatopsis marina]SFA93483.1 deazaflavin-dependent oxidoreductase, nitroreductase family [Amycolatopsis marina]